jgi:flavodoxin
MNALVVYDSKFGNTERIARAIGEALEETVNVEVCPFAEVDTVPPVPDLLIVGGPTHAHGIDPAFKAFLDGLSPDAVEGVAVAAFDTRFRMPVMISGSAARGIAKRLVGKGAYLVAEPESFFVKHSEGPLAEGEVERAETWARELAGALATVA